MVENNSNKSMVIGGVRSILADMEVRTASKSMGHDPRTHFATYTQTYELKDAKKQAKKYQK